MTKDRLAELKKIKDKTKAKHAGKKFTTLSTKDKDALIETMARMLGLIE